MTSPSNHKKHLLFYEPRTEGHHLGWMRFIADDLLSANFQLTIAADLRPGDWYPDRQTRLWRRGQVRWSDAQVHESPQVNGTVGKLHAELRHYLTETIDHQIRKISTYTEAFARAAAEQNRRVGRFDLLTRPGWRFVRSYFFRLGFLDGWQGIYIAWMTAFYTATRYAKIRAAQTVKNPPH